MRRVLHPSAALTRSRRRPLLAACALASHLSASGRASADIPLRVIGTATLDASATLAKSAVLVRASLQDDTKRPIAGRELYVTLFDAAGSPAGAGNAHDCSARAQSVAADAQNQYAIRTDAAGAACIRFDSTPEHGAVGLTFTDPDHFFGAVSRRIAVEPERQLLSLTFLPAPSAFPLELAQQRVIVGTRMAASGTVENNPERVAIRLSFARAGQAPRRLPEQRVSAGENAEFHIDRHDLGGPGTLTVAADFAGSDAIAPAHAAALVMATARVELGLPEPIVPADPKRGMSVPVSVKSVAGAVTSGAVEARSRGSIVGMGRVAAGTADVFVRLDARSLTLPVEFRYVPDTPWWVPGESVSKPLPLAVPSAGPRLLWIAGAVALALWLVAGWRRPRRAERGPRAPDAPPLPRAAVDVVALGEEHSGWQGRVSDAHDGSAIAGAVLAVRVPSFHGEGIVGSSRSDESGKFQLGPSPTAEDAGAALVVRAPWHGTLEVPLPPPGRLEVTLISRRRALLIRFVEWAARAKLWSTRGEPTPGEIANRVRAEPELRAWAEAVDEAAFGPEAVSEAKEQSVLEREPRLPTRPAERGH